MSCAIWLLYFVGMLIVDGFQAEADCDFNQTLLAKEGSTATFWINFTHDPVDGFSMYQTSGYIRRNLFKIRRNSKAIGRHFIRSFYDDTWKIRANIELYSDDTREVRIDLTNVSIKDNGTYRLDTGKNFGMIREIACFKLLILQIKPEPSSTREENEPVLVYAHPHASIVESALPNATITWLLDGEAVDQTASFIQQDGLIWISNVGRGLDGKNITYRVIHNDGRIIEINTTLKVEYGPSHPLTFDPKVKHYYLVSGTLLPDITCTSQCNPPCNISWGKHSLGSTLRLGVVTTDDTGEYTCTATRVDGQAVEQTISIYVGNCYGILVLTCLGSAPVLTFFVLGMLIYLVCKRKCPCCCQEHDDSKTNKPVGELVTLPESLGQVSVMETYDDLVDTRNISHTYSALS